ncbi:MAG TPA: hypothetical protein EYP86_02520, partial [Candidatus Altiarchaeales archaeon]|nr:hypothetical protein [Candidatus Altiarchaeales archaeon]
CVSYPDGSNVTYTYDSNGNLIQAINNNIGLNDVTSFIYDPLDRRISTVTNYGLFIETLNYTYDAVGNVITIDDPQAGTTTYNYDSLDRLTNITNYAGNITTYQYDKLGRLINISYSHGVYTSFEYDFVGNLLNLTTKASNGSIISSYTYDYDEIGNRIFMKDKHNNFTYYEYDELSQLINVTYPDNSTVVYLYDAVGNRLSKTTNQYSISYAYDEDNRLVSAGYVSYFYDGNGNLIQKLTPSGTTNYTYDYENRLVQVTLPDHTSIFYNYSATGRRLCRVNSTDTTYYAYNGINILRELNGTGVINAQYTNGLGTDKPICMDKDNDTYYYHFDGIGSVSAITNTSEKIVAIYHYDEFGILTNATDPIGNNLRFIGREYDSQTSLYYCRARYYDANTGRFLNPDPLQFLSGQFSPINTYPYCENNPVNQIDQLGLQAQPITSYKTPSPVLHKPKIRQTNAIERTGVIRLGYDKEILIKITFDWFEAIVVNGNFEYKIEEGKRWMRGQVTIIENKWRVHIVIWIGIEVTMPSMQKPIRKAREALGKARGWATASTAITIGGTTLGLIPVIGDALNYASTAASSAASSASQANYETAVDELMKALMRAYPGLSFDSDWWVWSELLDTKEYSYKAWKDWKELPPVKITSPCQNIPHDDDSRGQTPSGEGGEPSSGTTPAPGNGNTVTGNGNTVNGNGNTVTGNGNTV